jgi:UDP-N-acetylglucosamine 2-epimerase
MRFLKNYKIISIVGARPQFIKLAGLYLTLKHEPRIQHVIVHSGQHYDYNMSGRFFEELNIASPDYNIGIGSTSHNQQIARCMLGLDDIFQQENPDLVIVYGDTNTTAAGAIAAAKRNIAVAHVEAGLREFDKSIPEEVNKLIADALTDLYFTPTETGRLNLLAEGKDKNVFVTGDISLDLLVNNHKLTDSNQPGNEKYIFVTCHRASNTDDKNNLREILEAIYALEYKVRFALHPRTKKAIKKYGYQYFLESSHIEILEPQGFWETQRLIKNAVFVLTDSGGIIKETYFYKVPGIILDKQTEWSETVNEGWNTISGPDKNKILNAIHNWKKPERHSNCIGDGKAGERIVREILNYLDVKR